MNVTDISNVKCIQDQNYMQSKIRFSAVRIPAIGETVTVNMNGLGSALVLGYEIISKGTYLGLRVKFLNPPKWYVDQNAGNPITVVYGAECDIKESVE